MDLRPLMPSKSLYITDLESYPNQREPTDIFEHPTFLYLSVGKMLYKSTGHALYKSTDTTAAANKIWEQLYKSGYAKRALSKLDDGSKYYDFFLREEVLSSDMLNPLTKFVESNQRKKGPEIIRDAINEIL